MRLRRSWLFALVVMSLLLVAANPLHAQESEIVLQLAVPGYMEDLFNQGLLGQFEAEHPGVRVELVTSGGAGMVVSVGGGTRAIEDALDDMEARARSADVVAVNSSDLTPEITRAGYFLDLLPLANTDAALDTADFYPSLWQSFQWDGGLWALPAAADPILLFYDRAAFDAAGLPYPETWRGVADVEMAVRTLTQLNPDGTVARMGFMNFGSETGLLLLALLGQPLYDSTVNPAVPAFDNPDLEALLTTWAQLKRDGLFEQPVIAGEDGQIAFLDAPLQIARSAFSGGPPDAAPKTPALLPGGRAGLNVDGYAVSNGTQHPEEAYELARFLTGSGQASAAFLGSMPARRSLAGSSAEGGPTFGGQRSPELEALLPTALENAIPVSEARFSEFLPQAVDQMAQNDLDARAALQMAEETILERLDAAAARRDVAGFVVTPPPTANLAPGEIALNFGIGAMISPLPNQAQWDALAAEFAASDPDVGVVNLQSGFFGSLDEMAERYDCFTMSSNMVPTTDLSLLRSLDPLLASDPAFDPADMVNGVLTQVQRDGQTWALPLSLEPLVMRYNADLFAQAGAIPPSGEWTVGDFENALRALKAHAGDDEPFKPGGSFGNTHLLMLIAAYGGLPVDYRTTPPTLNFTDPATVDAIRQVLDLARNGTMDYSALVSAGGGFVVAVGEGGTSTPLYTQTLNGLGGLGGVIAFGGGSGEIIVPQNADPIVLFPRGSRYTPVSYAISAAYISARSPYADACYRFISQVASTPGLISTMPARRSMIDHPEIAAAQGPEVVAFYHLLDDLLQRPDVVAIPSGAVFDRSALGGTLLTFWLNRAFDRYVNEGADLDLELAEAQTFTEAYQQCAAGIPPYNPALDAFETYYQQFQDCAVRADPSISDDSTSLSRPSR